MIEAVQNLLTRAISLHQSGQLDSAEELYRAVLALHPRDPNGLHLLGVIAAQKGEYIRAVDLLSAAIKVDKKQAPFHSNLGISLHALGRLSEALSSFDKALKISPSFPDALANRGSLLRDMGRLDDALRDLNLALRLNSQHPEALNNRGNVLRDLKRYDEALASFDTALAIRPSYLEALNNRGAMFVEMKDYRRAAAELRTVTSLYPNSADAHSNLGTALLFLGDIDGAIDACGKSVQLNPRKSQFLLNYGNAFKQRGRFAEALKAFSLALELTPDFSDAALNKGIIHLLQGDFEKGWPLYEMRKSQPGYEETFKRKFSQPLWRGEELTSKRILVQTEQGYGDVIHFCRYAENLKNSSASVILESPKELIPVLSTLSDVDHLVEPGQMLTEADYYIPLLSLPYIVGTTRHTIPGRTPYLFSSPDRVARWRARLGTDSHKRKKIGLVFSGNPNHKSDRYRSIAANEFQSILSLDADFICLQDRIRDSDKAFLATSSVLNLENEIRDFGDTAALCDLCDLVISVDTSVAHLAAALGRPTWILLHHDPDWRWMTSSPTSPWYPSVRLWRREFEGGWQPVMISVTESIMATL